MKRLVVLAIVALLFSCGAFALDDAPSYTAFTVNYSYHNVHTDCAVLKTSWGTDDKSALAHGFNFGLTFQQKLYKWMVLVCGLQYQFTTANEDGLDLTAFGIPYVGESKFFNHNIIVPVKVGFSIPFAGKSSLTIYGGPSLDFAVSTQSEYYYNSNNYVSTDWVAGKNITKIMGNKTTTKNDEYKKMSWFDIPLGVGAVLTFGRFGLKFDYEWGMIDRWKGDGKFKSDQLTAGILITL